MPVIEMRGGGPNCFLMETFGCHVVASVYSMIGADGPVELFKCHK